MMKQITDFAYSREGLILTAIYKISQSVRLRHCSDIKGHDSIVVMVILDPTDEQQTKQRGNELL